MKYSLTDLKRILPRGYYKLLVTILFKKVKTHNTPSSRWKKSLMGGWFRGKDLR